MIDFHTHILPGIDDGASDAKESLLMLRECVRQGVDTVFATPHFYADSDDPQRFLSRRDRAYDRLISIIKNSQYEFPRIYCGAEILYFPGMSEAEELGEMTLGNLPCLLIEPPMIPWSENMLDEIEQTGDNLRCIPIIAHIDRYMSVLNDFSLIERVQGRKILVQVNASFFLSRRTRELAVRLMKEGKFQFLGSDCHDLTERPPNLIGVVDAVKALGAEREFASFVRKEKAVFEIA